MKMFPLRPPRCASVPTIGTLLLVIVLIKLANINNVKLLEDSQFPVLFYVLTAKI